jgi:SAM-dependent methyltransferase
MSSMGPENILGAARAFMESRILLTGAELDIFTLLDGAALSADELAARLPADARALTALLDALVSMDLLSKEQDRYRTPPDVARTLSASSPDSVLPMILHSAGLWHRWGELTTRVCGPQGPAHRPDTGLTAFIGAMHVIGSRMAPRIAAAAKPGAATRLLDIGGGSGTYTMAFLEASPDLKATLFDRPDVVEMARARLAQAGMLDRVTLAPGDFYADPLPAGHDLALLSAIIHQNSREQNVELYRKVYAALVPGGRLVIRDHIMSLDHTQPKSGALFAINMLAGTPGGGTFTFDEIREDLVRAGFERVRLVQPDTAMDGLVEAFRP